MTLIKIFSVLLNESKDEVEYAVDYSNVKLFIVDEVDFYTLEDSVDVLQYDVVQGVDEGQHSTIEFWHILRVLENIIIIGDPSETNMSDWKPMGDRYA